MNSRSLKNCILFIVFIAYILLYKLFIFTRFMKYSELICASFLVVLVAVSIRLLGFHRMKGTLLSKNILRVVIFYLFLAFFVMYGLGIIAGFLKNAYSRNILTLIDNIFAPIVIIILVEIFRYVVIWANRDRKIVIVLFTMILCAFELCLSIRSFQFADFAELFNCFATVMLPIVIKNIVLSYFAYHIGFKIPIIYRLVMDIYVFVVPFLPNIGNYVTSMVLISLPILIYISSFAMIDNRYNQPEPVFYNTKFTVADGVIAVILLSLIALISGFFPHYMIGVGSDSMNPVISKGDAVILRKVTENTKLKKGDIIAYTKGNVVIVHRISQIHEEQGNVFYSTKGDANNSDDAKVVMPDQIEGVYRLKIPFVAYPTVWLSELLNHKE